VCGTSIPQASARQKANYQTGSRPRLRVANSALSLTHRGDVSRDRKFGERRHRAIRWASVVVSYYDLFARRLHCQLAGLALGLPRSLAFLPHEAMVAGRLIWAVGARSAPRVEQDLRATIWRSQPLSRQRKVRRLLERLGSPVSSPATEPLSLMLGFAWSYSLPLRYLRHGDSIRPCHLNCRAVAIAYGQGVYGIVSGRSLRARTRARSNSMTNRPGYRKRSLDRSRGQPSGCHAGQ
jgi:hypothetical protein